MITKYLKVDSLYPNIIVLKEAAEIIRNGGLVAFPTETVYGLGADGFNEDAVEKIFIAKGRPMDNPLILHVSSLKDVMDIASYVSLKAKKVINAFWPGPITLVLQKNLHVPYEVSAGLPTVGVRMPSHPVALKLIKLARVPVAAPSANLSGRPSPTTGFHVLKDLKGKIDMIVDGGPSRWGIESSVVDFTGETPTILRPGAITKEMLEGVVGKVNYDPGLKNNKIAPKSPGVKYIHYAPKGDMYLVQGDKPLMVASKLNELVQLHKSKDKRVAIIATDETLQLVDSKKADYTGSLGSKHEQELIASRIYHLLRNCDKFNMDVILTEGVSQEGLGVAIMNRLLKASGNRVIKA